MKSPFHSDETHGPSLNFLEANKSIMLKTLFGLGLLLFGFSWFLWIPFIPLTGSKPVQAEFLTVVQEPKLLLYFGFPLCGNECPITMSVLAQAYRNTQPTSSQSDIAVGFVDLTPRPRLTSPEDYARGFHRNFYGFDLDKQELQQIQNDLGIKWEYDENFNIPIHENQLYYLEKKRDRWFLQQVFLDPSITFKNVSQVMD